MSPIPQTSFLVWTFFAVSYSKPALVICIVASYIWDWRNPRLIFWSGIDIASGNKSNLLQMFGLLFLQQTNTKNAWFLGRCLAFVYIFIFVITIKTCSINQLSSGWQYWLCWIFVLTLSLLKMFYILYPEQDLTLSVFCFR